MGIALCLFLLFLCVALPTYNRTDGLQDIGEYLNNPVRILHGEMPYRNFWLVMPPMETLLPAVIYRIFGMHMGLLLALNAIISAAAGSAAFLTGRMLFKKIRSAALLSLIVFFGSPLYYYAGYNHSNWFFLSMLLATYYFAGHLITECPRLLAYTGGFAALASSFRLYETAPFYAGALSALFFFNAAPAIRRSGKASVLLVSGAVFWIAMLAAFFPADAPAALRAITADSVGHAIAFYKTEIPHALSDVVGDTNAVRMYAKALLAAGAMPQAVLAAWRTSYYSADLMRRSLTYVLLLLAVALGISGTLSGGRTGKKISLWLLVWLLALAGGKLAEGIDSAVLAFAVLPAAVLLIRRTEKEPKAFWGAAAKTTLLLYLFFSAYVTLGEQAHKIKSNIYPIFSEAGTLFAGNRTYAEETEAVIRSIASGTEHGGYAAVLHTGPYPFFAATGRRNAVYYDSLIDLRYRPSSAKENAICRDLLRTRARVIAIESVMMAEGSRFETIKACIKKSFDIGSVYANYLVYYPRAAP